MKVYLVLLFFTLSTCTFPQDPEGSFRQAKKKALLVGVVENPPFVVIRDSVPSGIEIEKLREFSRQNDLEVQYVYGTETELVNKLKKYKLHIVAGGFEKETIWKKKAGLTSAYDQKHVFLIPKGENRLLKQLESFILKGENR